MVKVNYSEKQYEQLFNLELINSYRADPRAFTPSQNEEKKLGFDAAHIVKPDFIHFIKKRNKLFGSNNRINNGKVPYNPLHAVPSNYHANLFIQFKKPEYLTTSRAKQYSQFGGPYFRYELYQSQLKTLENLNNKFKQTNSFAYILYASSTARNLKELFNQCTSQSIIKYSSLAEISQLVGHKIVVYDKPTHFIACSEPVEYFSMILEDILREEPKETTLESTLDTLEEYIEQNEEQLYQLYTDSFDEIDELELTENERKFISIEWISNFLGLSWSIVSRNKAN